MSVIYDGKHVFTSQSEKELYDQIQQIDKSSWILEPKKLPIDLAAGIKGVLDQLDGWRIYLADIAYYLSMYFSEGLYGEACDEEAAMFEDLKVALHKAAAWPGHDGSLLIRYRGVINTSPLAERIDYVIRFGHIEFDISMVNDLIQRMGIPQPHLRQRVANSFKTFFENGISTIRLKIPGVSESETGPLRHSLRILSRYYQALRSEVGNIPENDWIVLDEKNRPDPNLTVLGRLNEIDRPTLKKWVHHLGKMLTDSDRRERDIQYLSVFDALFGVKNLPAVFERPPVEINNIGSLVNDMNGRTYPKDMARVIRSVMETFGGASPSAARIMESIYGGTEVYGNDFREVDGSQIGRRLLFTQSLLQSDRDDSVEPIIEKEVFSNVGKRLLEVHDDVFEGLFIPEEFVERYQGGKKKLYTGTEVMKGLAHQRIRKMIHYYKVRTIARKKIKTMIGSRVQFNEQDYAIIARDFHFTKAEAQFLVKLIQSCFDVAGNFRKAVFEKNIPKFGKYEANVFDFLWHYLKAVNLPRSNRITFLNSLQLLVAVLELREKAVRILLSDVFRDPAVIHFSDRNALMLANILLRKYNKEINMNIEQTPEEVLLVREGLKMDLIRRVSKLIDEYQELFLIKALTIQQKIKESLSRDDAAPDMPPPRYLLALEREVHLLFSLVEGATATAVIRIAMSEYGDPDSDIFHLKYSREFMNAISQRLRVVIRGFGRIGEEEDLSVLQKFQRKSVDFLKIPGITEHMVKRFNELADLSVKQIHYRMV